jgi:hypothetical protein
MMTNALNRTANKQNLIKLAVWNVREIGNKESEPEKEK